MRSSHALALALGITGPATACGTDGNGPNISPAIAFTPSCALLVCSFSAGSSGVGTDVVAYHWDFGDGATADTQSSLHSYASAGIYLVVLAITDDNGAIDRISKRVTVKATQPGGTTSTRPWFFRGGFQHPADYAKGPKSYVASALSVTTGIKRLSSAGTSGRVGPDGTIVSIMDFGDGETSDVPSPAHIYASGGVYHAALAVADDRGGTARGVRDVTVAAPVPNGPLAFSDSAIGFCYRPASTRSCVRLEEHVLFTSTGGKALKWTAVSEPWIILRPVSGTTPTDVRVSVDMRNLPPVGSSLSVSGVITVSASGASAQTIPVKLQFYAQPVPR